VLPLSTRIAILAPIAWRMPPRHYGAWETVAHNHAEGLAARGYDVTLFGTADTETCAALSFVAPRPYLEDRSLDPKVWEARHIGACLERAGEFDVVHNHYDFLPLTYARLLPTPMVTTVHGFSSEQVRAVYHHYADLPYVAISDADRDPALRYLATVYNGIRLDGFAFDPDGSDALVFLGRFHPEKGPHLAIEVARRAGRRLVLAGIKQDERYFEEAIAPHVDGDRVRFVGPVGPEERRRLLGGAAALLHLVTEPERFGLVMAEAMACGTPVIGMGLGSVPEVVAHGETGFVASSVAEAVEAVRRLPELSRRACRRRVETRFSVEQMIDGYLAAYERLLS
jgi:glycosyltransferase involved in cell wall biosynthesis